MRDFTDDREVHERMLPNTADCVKQGILKPVGSRSTPVGLRCANSTYMCSALEPGDAPELQ